MVGCATAGIEKRLEKFTSDMGIGFALDAVISDLSNLREHKTHLIEKEKIKGAYQGIIDVCIRNNIPHDVLRYLMEIRDEKETPEPAIRYVIKQLEGLDIRYLSSSQEAVREGVFRR
jgi:hypothetical protein